MSGTSMDGIDAACIQTDGEAHIHEMGHIQLSYNTETRHLLKAAEHAIQTANGHLDTANRHFKQALHTYLTDHLNLNANAVLRRIQDLSAFIKTFDLKAETISLHAVTQLSTQLHAEAVTKLITDMQIQAKRIDMIGYHGQTMYHNPRAKISIQLGDGPSLAKLTQTIVVTNFRKRDIEAGGQGAPFAPLFHQALAIRDQKIPLIVVNCGGIANLTLIRSKHIDDVYAFDTGPGNGLIDAFVKKRTQGRESMDKNGQYGLQGHVNQAALARLFEHSIKQEQKNYLHKKPPKSLDIHDMAPIPELDTLSLEDGCATLEAFTGETIVNSLSLIDLPSEHIPRHWVLAGGGWYNPVIRETLSKCLYEKYGHGFIIETANQAGWNTDALEAQIFAYFAVRCIQNLPLSAPNTTGVPMLMSGGEVFVP